MRRFSRQGEGCVILSSRELNCDMSTPTTALGSPTINMFGSLIAEQEAGSNDTVHQQSIDFALQTIGNWTSV